MKRYLNKLLYRLLLVPVKLLNRARRNLLLAQFRKVGSNFIYSSDSSILTPQYMDIGDNVFIGEGAHISAEVEIGNNVMFGPRPTIIGGDHYFAVKGRSVTTLFPKERENSEKIRIEDEVWFGASVVILRGVTVGMGSVIGAGSVVTKSIPPYVVAVGNYCKPISKIFSDEDLYEHLIRIGQSADAARTIVLRRSRELESLKLAGLRIIDNTHEYWDIGDETVLTEVKELEYSGAM